VVGGVGASATPGAVRTVRSGEVATELASLQLCMRRCSFRVFLQGGGFLFLFFSFSFFTKIYFYFRNLQKYTLAAQLL